MVGGVRRQNLTGHKRSRFEKHGREAGWTLPRLSKQCPFGLRCHDSTSQVTMLSTAQLLAAVLLLPQCLRVAQAEDKREKQKAGCCCCVLCLQDRSSPQKLKSSKKGKCVHAARIERIFVFCLLLIVCVDVVQKQTIPTPPPHQGAADQVQAAQNKRRRRRSR